MQTDDRRPVFPVILLIPLIFLLWLVLELAFAAFSGFLVMVTGHALLRLSFDGYLLFPLQHSMQIGAVGAVIVHPVLRAIHALGRLVEPNNLSSDHLRRGLRSDPVIFSGWIVGVVGSKLLNGHGYQVMDPLHAAGAGLLGGIFAGPAIVLVMVFFLAPILPLISWNSQYR